MTAALDVAWRLTELVALFDQADAVLARAVAMPLTRADLGLRERADTTPIEEADEPAA